MRDGLIGGFSNPAKRDRPEPGVPWALDNGCFTGFDEVLWRRALKNRAGNRDCLFAVVPDRVGDATTTDAWWPHYAPIVKQHGLPAAYAVQNDCTSVPDDADAVFIGGDDTWKLSEEAQEIARSARRRGLWTHMGRVNSLQRLRFAHALGYDSVDGTHVSYEPDEGMARLLKFMQMASHPTLWDAS